MPAQHWTLNAAGRWQTGAVVLAKLRDNLVAGSSTIHRSHHRHARLADHHAGDFVTTSASQVVQNLNITGRVKISRQRHLRNCRIKVATRWRLASVQ